MRKQRTWFPLLLGLLVLSLGSPRGTLAAPPTAPTGAACGASYVVRWGDTLSWIAAWNDTTVAQLQTLNNIVNPNRIYAGQALCLYAAPSTPSGLRYTVRWGDTLSSIAWRYGVTYWDLAVANNLANPNWIYAGQVLFIPTGEEPGQFTQVNIHLIALEDAGQSGPEIGCGDSVVPVQVTIAPTNAPLTAALQALLAIDDQYYGQSGLYNALYQSDLYVDDVQIVNHEAIVHLSGSVTVGGVCDEPRVQAQLRETILQFSTVDSASIFVNGTQLDDSLQ
jgi:LysM repeat protein